MRRAIARLALDNRSNVDEVILLPLIAWFNVGGSDGYGRKTEVAREMSKLTGRRITRDMVRCWLNRSRSKRRQPSFFYGLLLIAAAHNVMRSDFRKINKSTQYHANNHSKATAKKRIL